MKSSVCHFCRRLHSGKLLTQGRSIACSEIETSATTPSSHCLLSTARLKAWRVNAAVAVHCVLKLPYAICVSGPSLFHSSIPATFAMSLLHFSTLLGRSSLFLMEKLSLFVCMLLCIGATWTCSLLN